jgi:hypothetical protein
VFKEKNVFSSKDEPNGKQKLKVQEICEEQSIIDVTGDDWPSESLESSSFR